MIYNFIIEEFMVKFIWDRCVRINIGELVGHVTL